MSESRFWLAYGFLVFYNLSFLLRPPEQPDGQNTLFLDRVM